jgi:hypothetical protein
MFRCSLHTSQSHHPTIGCDPWTDAEDHILMEAQEKHGRRWNIISGYLPGRPAVHCRNRWLSLLRAGRITDGIQKAAAMVDTSTLRPIASGPFISPAPSPTPSHCSSGFESSVEPFYNGWENQTVLSPPESTEQYPEGFPMNFVYLNTGPSSSQHTSHGHHRSESSSSTLSWANSFSSADFDAGSLMDQASYNQGAISPEITNVVMPNASRTGSPSQLDSQQTITLTPPPIDTQSESLIMTCSLPYCTFQSTSLTDIWRHMTWDHIGNKTHCPPEMSTLVEKWVIGSGSMTQ